MTASSAVASPVIGEDVAVNVVVDVLVENVVVVRVYRRVREVCDIV